MFHILTRLPRELLQRGIACFKMRHYTFHMTPKTSSLAPPRRLQLFVLITVALSVIISNIVLPWTGQKVFGALSTWKLFSGSAPERITDAVVILNNERTLFSLTGGDGTTRDHYYIPLWHMLQCLGQTSARPCHYTIEDLKLKLVLESMELVKVCVAQATPLDYIEKTREERLALCQ